MTGRWEASIHPLAQSILGWLATNHGYPRMIRWWPRSVRKNLMTLAIDPVLSPPLVSVKVKGAVVVREQQGDNVKPNPEYEGCYESQGYDYVSELDHDMCWEVMDFEGHKRVVRVPH